MKVISIPLEGVVIVEPDVFCDDRGEVISLENKRQLYVPESFAHGFL